MSQTPSKNTPDKKRKNSPVEIENEPDKNVKRKPAEAGTGPGLTRSMISKFEKRTAPVSERNIGDTALFSKLTPVFSDRGKKGDTAGGQHGLARQPHGGGGGGAQGGGAVSGPASSTKQTTLCVHARAHIPSQLGGMPRTEYLRAVIGSSDSRAVCTNISVGKQL